MDGSRTPSMLRFGPFRTRTEGSIATGRLSGCGYDAAFIARDADRAVLVTGEAAGRMWWTAAVGERLSRRPVSDRQPVTLLPGRRAVHARGCRDASACR